MNNLQFSMAEILSLFGVVQCVFILVYLFSRGQQFKQILFPALYFLVLGGAFSLDFGQRFIGELHNHYELWALSLWFSGPPLSVLVVLQLCGIHVSNIFSLRRLWIVALPPIAFFTAYGFSLLDQSCVAFESCQSFYSWFVVFGIISGALSLLTLWIDKSLFQNLRGQKLGQERYWLVLTVIISNIVFVTLMFSYFSDNVSSLEISQIRTVIGLVFVYLVMTSLFRVYPQLIELRGAASNTDKSFSKEDEMIAREIERLIDRDKIYHEFGIGRSEIARELGVPETTITRVINQNFQKSVPQLLNERRIQDAKRLLDQTEEPMSIIAKEVGFNSVPTFNRVFKEIEGVTPSEYRKNARNIIY
ncbi:MAG: helix-turn-helix domain-containing protein [Alphaproteobacteria bacterium]